MSDSMRIKNEKARLYSGTLLDLKKLIDENIKNIGSFVKDDNKDSYCNKIKNEFIKISTEYNNIYGSESSVDTDNEYEIIKGKLDNFIKVCNDSIDEIKKHINLIYYEYNKCIDDYSSYLVFNNTDYENNYMKSLLDLIKRFTTMKSVHYQYKNENDFDVDYKQLNQYKSNLNICELLRLYQFKLKYSSEKYEIKASGTNAKEQYEPIANILLDSSKIIQKINISLLKTIKNLFVDIASNYSRAFGGIDFITVILDDTDYNFYCPTYLNTDFTVDFENPEVQKSLKLMRKYYDGLYSSVKNKLSDSNFSTTTFDEVSGLMYGYVFYRKIIVITANQNANLMKIEDISDMNMNSIRTIPFDKHKICICGALPINYQELIQKLNFNYKVNIRDAYIKTANIMYYYSGIVNTLVNEKYDANANEKICQFYDSSKASDNCDYNIINFKSILKDYKDIIDPEITSYHYYIFQGTSDNNKITESSLNKFTDNNLLVGNMTRSSKILNNADINSHSFDELINAIDPQKGSWVITFIIALIVGILSVVGSIFFVIKKNGTEVSTEDELKSTKKTIKIWYNVCLIGLVLSMIILAVSLIVLYNVSKNTPANKIRAEILFTGVFIILISCYIIYFYRFCSVDNIEIKLVVKEPEKPTDTNNNTDNNSTTPDQTN